MNLIRVLRIVIVATAIVVLGACGGDQPDVSASASAVLQERVAEIRTLAEAREAAAVIAKVDELRSVVEQLRDDGEITDEAAEQILASAAEVVENVATITTTTTTTTTTQPPPPDDDDDEDEDDDEEKDGEKGKGRGGNRGKGGDDD